MGIKGILQDLKSYIDAVEETGWKWKIYSMEQSVLVASNYADEVLDALIEELEPENLPKHFFGTTAAIQMLRFKKVRREIVGWKYQVLILISQYKPFPFI